MKGNKSLMKIPLTEFPAELELVDDYCFFAVTGGVEGVDILPVLVVGEVILPRLYPRVV